MASATHSKQGLSRIHLAQHSVAVWQLFLFSFFFCLFFIISQLLTVTIATGKTKSKISPATIIGLLMSIMLTQIAGPVALTTNMVWSGDLDDLIFISLVFERNAKPFSSLIVSLHASCSNINK